MQTLKDIDYDGPITPISDEKRITSLPYDISAILSGGYLSLVWKKSLTEKSG